jgi:hypothetical protein
MQQCRERGAPAAVPEGTPFRTFSLLHCILSLRVMVDPCRPPPSPAEHSPPSQGRDRCDAAGRGGAEAGGGQREEGANNTILYFFIVIFCSYTFVLGKGDRTVYVYNGSLSLTALSSFSRRTQAVAYAKATDWHGRDFPFPAKVRRTLTALCNGSLTGPPLPGQCPAKQSRTRQALPHYHRRVSARAFATHCTALHTSLFTSHVERGLRGCVAL